MALGAMIRKPSGFVPIAMAARALAVVALQLGLVGPARQADEGAFAHLWQLLKVAQRPIVLFFVIGWLPRYPRSELEVLALQACAALAALAPVFMLR